MSTKPPNSKKTVSWLLATVWWSCGNVNGNNSSKKTTTWEAWSNPSTWSPDSNPETRSTVEAPNTIKLYHQVEQGEKVHYLDFTSLYPWTNKNCPFPVGLPVIIHQPEGTDISSYFGLVKCKILPPFGLYHPVLPHRSGGKLTFPLCRTCVEHEQPKPLTERSHRCIHNEQERCLVGTWPTPELQEAIRQGYVIQHVYEIWHFRAIPITCFLPMWTLFSRSSEKPTEGPIGWVTMLTNARSTSPTAETRKAFNSRPTRSKKPGRRSLAKMILNSF